MSDFEEATETGESKLTGWPLRKKVGEICAHAGIQAYADKRLLEFLVQEERLSLSEAEEFVAAAVSRGLDLLNYSLETRIASEDEVLRVQAAVYEQPPVVLSQIQANPTCTRLINAETARELRALPYDRTEEGNLLVATSSPVSQSPEISQRLQRLLPNEKIEWRLALYDDLTAKIEQSYGDGDTNLTLVEEPESAPTLSSAGADSPLVRMLDEIIRRAVKGRASDVHLEPTSKALLIRFRVDGVLQVVRSEQRGIAASLIRALKTRAEMREYDTLHPQDGRFRFELENRRIDVRVVTIPLVTGEMAVMRILDPTTSTRKLDQLGMTAMHIDRLRKIIHEPHGVLIVCGPTGSGKSTTLAASLREIASNEIKTISIEEPVEIYLDHVQQVDVPRRGDKEHTFTVSDALEKVLRADPNVIMVGEVRDPETAKLAIEAAQTGHFVFTSLHTNDAISAVTRLVDLDIKPFLIGSTLSIVVAQRLMRLLCQNCRTPRTYTADDLKARRIPDGLLKVVKAADDGTYHLFEAGRGCGQCNQTGFRGRVGVHEVLIVNEEMKEVIASGAPDTEYQLKALARDPKNPERMMTLWEDGWVKVMRGMTSIDELERWVK